MVDIYATLIINGRRTFGSVPKWLKTKVEAKLKELGYSTDGSKIVAPTEAPIETNTEETTETTNEDTN